MSEKFFDKNQLRLVTLIQENQLRVMISLKVVNDILLANTSHVGVKPICSLMTVSFVKQNTKDNDVRYTHVWIEQSENYSFVIAFAQEESHLTYLTFSLESDIQIQSKRKERKGVVQSQKRLFTKDECNSSKSSVLNRTN